MTTPFLAELEEQLRDAAEREVTPGRRRRTIASKQRLRSLIHAAPLVVAVGVGMIVFVLAVLLLHRGQSHRDAPASTVTTPPGAVLPIGAPAGQTHPLKGGGGRNIEQGTIKTSAEARDLRGGLPWGLETYRTTDGQTCLIAGREQAGRVGVVGQDGTFHDDGRFHPLGRYTLSEFCAQTDGHGNAFITVGDVTTPASGNDRGPVLGGCQASRTSAGDVHTKACPPEDLRQLEYGLLGPDATSITYTAGGHAVTMPTGPGGAFIVVGPRGSRAAGAGGAAVSDQVLPGMVTTVKYRDGTTCRPRHILVPRHETRGCAPMGYVAPPHAHLTSAAVRAPISATLKTATRWCANSSGHYVACDGRVPAGYRVLRATAGMVLLQWSWIARVAAPGSNSGYEYAIKGGPPCGGGQSSSGPIAARRGQRIVQQSLGGFACAQRETISIEYRTNVGPGGANFANPPDPGHDGQPFVGSTSIDVPR